LDERLSSEIKEIGGFVDNRYVVVNKMDEMNTKI